MGACVMCLFWTSYLLRLYDYYVTVEPSHQPFHLEEVQAIKHAHLGQHRSSEKSPGVAQKRESLKQLGMQKQPPETAGLRWASMDACKERASIPRRNRKCQSGGRKRACKSQWVECGVYGFRWGRETGCAKAQDPANGRRQHKALKHK